MTGSAPRSVRLHPEQDLLQSARDFQRTPEFRKEYSLRIVVEHRIARLIQLGIRKARYFGRRKTVFHALMAAAVARLTLIANATAPMRDFVSVLVVLTFVVSLRFAWAQHHNSRSRLSAG